MKMSVHVAINCLLLANIPLAAFAQQVLTDADILRWNKKRNHYETTYIRDSLMSITPGDSIIVLPIGSSILQYTYDSSAVLDRETSRVEMLVQWATDKLFGSNLNLVNNTFSNTDGISIRESIDLTLSHFKLKRFESYQIEDWNFTNSRRRFLMGPI